MTTASVTIDTAFLNRQDLEIAAEWDRARGSTRAPSGGFSWRPTAPESAEEAPVRRKATLGLILGLAFLGALWAGGGSDLVACLTVPAPPAPVAALIW